MLKKAIAFAIITGLVGIYSPGLADFYVISSGGKRAGIEITHLPFPINSSGFYYITKDLTSSGDGITITADDVTIDLMGFSLIGPGSGSNNGICMNGRSNVEIRNGTIRSFGFYGIWETSQASGKNHAVRNVRTISNGLGGIHLYGKGCQVENCTVSGSGGQGIYADAGSVITGNVSNNNGGDGIYGNGAGLITGNVSRENGGFGIFAAGGSTLTGNNVVSNSYSGIYAASGSTVTGNTTAYNLGHGIEVMTGSYSGSTVNGNTSYSNSQDGIAVGASTAVIGNTVHINGNYGISFAHSCLVVNNLAYGNNTTGGAYANFGPCSSCTMSTNHAP